MIASPKSTSAVAGVSHGRPTNINQPRRFSILYRYLCFVIFVGALTTVYITCTSSPTTPVTSSDRHTRRILEENAEVAAAGVTPEVRRTNTTATATATNAKAKQAEVVSHSQSLSKGRVAVAATTTIAKAKATATKKKEGAAKKALPTVEKKQSAAKVPDPVMAKTGQSKPVATKEEGAPVGKRNVASSVAKNGEDKPVPKAEIGQNEKEGLVAAKETAPFSPHKDWQQTMYTSSHYVVAGVDLAAYGIGRHDGENRPEPFELYDDFDISDKIRGDEGWWDLVGYRRDLRGPGLPFYVDKVAQRRWLASEGVTMTRPLVHRYASELLPPSSRQSSSRVTSEKDQDEARAILSLLPNATSYAAKPTHMSCSDGVWLVDYDPRSREVVRVGRGHHRLEDVRQRQGGKNKFFDGVRYEIATSLAKSLHEDAADMESWALKAVRPGILVEERFVGWGNDDDVPATEFKCFAVWGRVIFAQWRSGGYQGQVLRDGSLVAGDESPVLPGWVDWSRVVTIAEKLAAHKDMYRVDIFVGVPADSPIVKEENVTTEEMRAATQVVVSETELHPTTRSIEPELFEEAARLWIAGYKMGRYRVVKNTEVPQDFLKTGHLPLSWFGSQGKKMLRAH